jgi:hypothetical protein
MVDLYPSGTTVYTMNAAHVTCDQGRRSMRLFWHRLNRAQRAPLRLNPGNGRKGTRRLASTLVAGNLSGASAATGRFFSFILITLPLLGRFGELPTAVNCAQAAGDHQWNKEYDPVGNRVQPSDVWIVPDDTAVRLTGDPGRARMVKAQFFAIFGTGVVYASNVRRQGS